LANSLALDTSAGTVLTRLGWTAIVGPVLAVAVLFAVVLGGRLHTYHDNATGFVLFGQHWVQYTHPPRGALINSPFGYDGQFFYLQAKDPLVLHAQTVAGFRGANEAFRLQRVAYPALAYLLAAGHRSAIPWSMLSLNVLVVLLITAGFAVYARERGWSGWWALAVGLLAGFLTGTLRDLSDPLAVASTLAGLMLWHSRRRWWAAALLTVAVLAREPMALAVVAVALDAAVRWWRGRGRPGALGAILREAWPPVVVPAVAFFGWMAYVDARYGANVAGTSQAYLPPFVGVIDEVGHALDQASLRDTLWDLAYLALMMAGIAAAIQLTRRRVTAASVAALLFGLSLLVLVFGDPWSYTRLSAPMFAALLLGGLEQRQWPALLVCAAAAALTAVVPFAPWLGSA
jgi:hypothetical protein